MEHPPTAWFAVFEFGSVDEWVVAGRARCIG
jgi:hypothetical protein